MKCIKWIVTGSLLFSITSHAASFDCKKAASSIEKIICSDHEISILDEDMSKSYENALKMLSEEGKRYLRESQKRWLHFVNSSCITYQNASGAPACVKEKYNDRIKDIGMAAVKIGPFVFSRIDYFYSKSDDNFGQPYQGQSSFPRIDSPLSASTKRWNALMAKKQADGDDWCDGQPGDVFNNYVIKSASEVAISVQQNDWGYCHGAPHGSGGTHGITYILQPEPHRLTASGLFLKGTPWKKILTEESYKVLEVKAEGVEIDRDQVMHVVTDPETWSITKDGLVVTIDPYAVFGYAFGTTEVIVPWSKLRPTLVANAPIPQ